MGGDLILAGAASGFTVTTDHGTATGQTPGVAVVTAGGSGGSAGYGGVAGGFGLAGGAAGSIALTGGAASPWTLNTVGDLSPGLLLQGVGGNGGQGGSGRSGNGRSGGGGGAGGCHLADERG